MGRRPMGRPILFEPKSSAIAVFQQIRLSLPELRGAGPDISGRTSLSRLKVCPHIRGHSVDFGLEHEPTTANATVSWSDTRLPHWRHVRAVVACSVAKQRASRAQ